MGTFNEWTETVFGYCNNSCGISTFSEQKMVFVFTVSIYCCSNTYIGIYFLLLYFITNTEACGKMTKFILAISILIVITSPLTGGFVDNLLSGLDYGDRYSGQEWNSSINIFRVLVSVVPIVLAFSIKI